MPDSTEAYDDLRGIRLPLGPAGWEAGGALPAPEPFVMSVGWALYLSSGDGVGRIDTVLQGASLGMLRQIRNGS